MYARPSTIRRQSAGLADADPMPMANKATVAKLRIVLCPFQRGSRLMLALRLSREALYNPIPNRIRPLVAPDSRRNCIAGGCADVFVTQQSLTTKPKPLPGPRRCQLCAEDHEGARLRDHASRSLCHACSTTSADTCFFGFSVLGSTNGEPSTGRLRVGCSVQRLRLDAAPRPPFRPGSAKNPHRSSRLSSSSR